MSFKDWPPVEKAKYIVFAVACVMFAVFIPLGVQFVLDRNASSWHERQQQRQDDRDQIDRIEDRLKNIEKILAP